MAESRRSCLRRQVVNRRTGGHGTAHLRPPAGTWDLQQADPLQRPPRPPLPRRPVSLPSAQRYWKVVAAANCELQICICDQSGHSDAQQVGHIMQPGSGKVACTITFRAAGVSTTIGAAGGRAGPYRHSSLPSAHSLPSSGTVFTAPMAPGSGSYVLRAPSASGGRRNRRLMLDVTELPLQATCGRSFDALGSRCLAFHAPSW